MSNTIDLSSLFHTIRVNHRLEKNEKGIGHLRIAALRGASDSVSQDNRIAALELQLAMLTQILVAKGVVSQVEMDKLAKQLEDTLQVAASMPFQSPAPREESPRPFQPGRSEPATPAAAIARAAPALVHVTPELEALAEASQDAIRRRRR
ncbi:MAG: hypothetical protein WD042_12490 [Phycisphaeraceae bacterium]